MFKRHHYNKAIPPHHSSSTRCHHTSRLFSSALSATIRSFWAPGHVLPLWSDMSAPHWQWSSWTMNPSSQKEAPLPENSVHLALARILLDFSHSTVRLHRGIHMRSVAASSRNVTNLCATAWAPENGTLKRACQEEAKAVGVRPWYKSPADQRVPAPSGWGGGPLA